MGEKSSIEKIKSLVRNQHFFVLCTHGDISAYGSLIAYGYSEDLKELYFATPKKTKKYSFLKVSKQVAAVIDNRSEGKGFKDLLAVTVKGRAEEVSKEDQVAFKKARDLIITRHDYLQSFLLTKDTSFFCLKDIEYLFTIDFSTLYKWKP